MKNTLFSPASQHNSPAALASHLPQLGKIAVLIATIAFAGMPIAGAVGITADEINIGSGETLSTDLPGGAAGLVIDTGTLTIHPLGQLNLRDNALIVRLGNFATIYGYLVTGYNSGAWNGNGINSSTAAADLQHLTGLGIIDNSEAHLPSFEGRPTLANVEILVKFARYGDANLDGLVNGLDVALMGTGFGWYHGDFNYSGTVDAADYALLNAALGSPLPEPGSMCLLLAGATVIGSRRARKI